MVSKIKIIAAWCSLVFAAFIGIFLSGRRSAKRDAKVDEAESIAKAKEIHDEIQILDDARIVELANKWVRNK